MIQLTCCWVANCGCVRCAQLQQLALVVHAFEPRETDDLALQPGQIVVLKQCAADKNWWEGALLEDRLKVGVFPKNRVEPLPKPDLPVAGAGNASPGAGMLGMLGQALFGGGEPSPKPTRSTSPNRPIERADDPPIPPQQTTIDDYHADTAQMTITEKPGGDVEVTVEEPGQLGVVWSLDSAEDGRLHMSIHGLLYFTLFLTFTIWSLRAFRCSPCFVC